MEKAIKACDSRAMESFTNDVFSIDTSASAARSQYYHSR